MWGEAIEAGHYVSSDLTAGIGQNALFYIFSDGQPAPTPLNLGGGRTILREKREHGEGRPFLDQRIW